MKYKIHTFGCRLNQLDSAIVDYQLKSKELQTAINAKVPKNNEKNLQNITFINTCGVTNKAIKDAKKSIQQSRKKDPHTIMVVSGCGVHTDTEFFKQIKGVDLILGNNEKHNLINSFNKLINHDKTVQITAPKSEKNYAKSQHLLNYKKTRALVQIQNGCNHHCTFCAIPQGRGTLTSLAPELIISHCKKLVDNGTKEIVLTGVDISDYGSDFNEKYNLTQLLQKIEKQLPELKRLRLSSLDPSELNSDFIDFVTSSKLLMPHLHLSIQSGDPLILKRMLRRHTPEQIYNFVEQITARRPEVTFGCDMIVGFPTETEENFTSSANMIKNLKLQQAHIFPFSSKLNTPAARMPQLASHIIKQRASELRKIAEKIKQEILEKMLHKKSKVLIENVSNPTDNTPILEFHGKNEYFQSTKIIYNKQKIDQKAISSKQGDIVNVDYLSVENNNLIASFASSFA